VEDKYNIINQKKKYRAIKLFAGYWAIVWAIPVKTVMIAL